MTGRSALSVLQHLHRLAREQQAGKLSDRECLERFRTQRDEEAFAVLVRRHGPMVRGVCRRVLRHAEDAEDVFQATFLVLARKAGSIRWKRSIAPWLYQVAYRLAHKGRVQAMRRREQQATAEPAAPTVDESWREMCGVLDVELHNLADKYRAPLVLCHLEGQTRDEAAERLGWSLGTLKRRLQKGRELLRLRLTRRGVTLPAVLLPAWLSGSEVEAALSTLAVRSLAQAATAFASGRAVSGPHLAAIAFAETALRTMSVSAVKLTAVLLLTLGLAAGAGVWTCRMLVRESPQAQPASPPEAARDEEEWQAAKDEQPRTDRYGDPLPPGAVARLGTVRLRHSERADSVVFTPDGKTLASSGGEGMIRLWDPATGKELRRFVVDARPAFGPNSGRATAVYGIAISPDGKTLASADNSGMVRAWDLPSHKCRFSREGHGGSYVKCVAISPDGRWLASGGGGNRSQTLVLWDLATGQEIRRLGDDMRAVKSVAFSPNGKLLAAASDVQPTFGAAVREGPGVVRLWEVATGKLHWEKEEETGGATSVAFAPDGKTVASAGYDAMIHIRDVAAGKEVHKIQVSEGRIPDEFRRSRKGYDWGGVLALAYSRDGKLLASASYDGTVRLWDTTTRRAMHVLHGYAPEATSVAFSPDGKTLASCGRDHTVRLWDVAGGKEWQPRQGHAGAVISLAVSRDGNRLVSAGLDQSLRMWDLKSGAEQYVLRGPGLENSVALSPNGQIVVAAGDDTIQLWDAFTARPLHRLTRQRGQFMSVVFSPDGKMLACGSTTGKAEKQDTLFLYDTVSGQELRRLAAAKDDFHLQVRFSADGRMLGSVGRGVHVWDSATGRLLYHGKEDSRFAFAPDGTTLVVRNNDKTIRLYDIPSGRELQRFADLQHFPGRNDAGGWAFALSPDGRTLARATKDNAIECWELASWKRRRRFTGHQGEIIRLLFSADGRNLLSASRDTTVLMWDRTRTNEAPKARLTASHLPVLWRDLLGEDGERADRAIWLLAAAPEKSVPYLEEHVHPIAALARERLERLIAELDSDQFAVRDKAMRELEELGELAEAALRKALTVKSSPEARRRVEELLTKLHGPLPAGERLRSLRAVEVLEQAGTDPARRLLTRLASGAPEARLTREAKGALQRLTAAGPPR